MAACVLGPCASSSHGTHSWEQAWGVCLGGDLMEGQTDSHPHGWREEDQSVALVATGETWDGATCAPACSVPPRWWQRW